jgi:DNA polymerase-3 subunit alpha
MSTEMGDSDKISKYIKDANDHGIAILSPNINKSHRKFGVEDGHVRFGMGAIKNVGDAALEEIFENRKAKGEFESFVDFCSRVSLRKVNKKVLESLIKTGVLDDIGEVNRASMLASLDNVITYAQSIQEDLNSDQFSMFDSMSSSNKKTSKPEPGRFFVKVEEFKQRELLEMEKELTGFYVSGHPLDEWKDLLNQMSDVPVSKMKELYEEQKDSVPADQQAISIDIATAGKLTVTREILIGSGRNKGLRMARASFEDFTGTIDAVMFSDVYEKQVLGKGFSLEDPIFVQAQLKVAQDKCEIHIRSLKPLISARDSKFKNVSIKLNLETNNCSDSTIRNLKSILLSHQGTSACELEIFTNSANCKTKLPKNIMVSPSNDMISAVNKLLGGENNVELK